MRSAVVHAFGEPLAIEDRPDAIDEILSAAAKAPLAPAPRRAPWTATGPE